MNYRAGLYAAVAFLSLSAPLAVQAQLGAGIAQDASSSDEGGGGGGANVGDRRWYVSPMFQYVYPDSVRNTEHGLGAQVGFGKKMTNGLNLELSAYYNIQGAEADGADDADSYGVGVGAMFFPLNNLPWLFGLVALQHGWADNNPGPGSVKDYDSTVFDSGVGVLFPLGDSGLSIRAEGRYRYDEHNQTDLGDGGDDKSFDGVANVGLFYPLGELEQPAPEAPAEEVAVVETAEPTDTDGDGVTDDLDQCPDTPAGTAVDDKGCPQAPAEPACPPPEPGQKVDLKGCAVGDTIVLRGVTFNFNEATLTQNAKVLLDGVADALLASPDITVEVGGHTDSVGDDAYNQGLSERRADAVKTYLTGRGVDAGRMTTAGYGEAQPVASNDTDSDREINRRVELKVTSGGAAAAPAAEAAPGQVPAEAAPAEGEAAPAEAPVEAAPAEASSMEAAPAEESPAETPAEEMPAEDAPTAEEPAPSEGF